MTPIYYSSCDSQHPALCTAFAPSGPRNPTLTEHATREPAEGEVVDRIPEKVHIQIYGFATARSTVQAWQLVELFGECASPVLLEFGELMQSVK